MRKFWSYVTNGRFSVGCTGQTVYLYDEHGNEIRKFKDIIYAYKPLISPDAKLFVVKSTDGRMAVYSLETLSLIKKFRYSKIAWSQDDGFCFSPDGKRLINVERQGDDVHSAISVYETEKFTRTAQLFLHDMAIVTIEVDKETNTYYVLGIARGDDGYFFVAKFQDNSIANIEKISENEYDFYVSYLDLKSMGFTEKAYEWSDLDCELERLKKMNHSLSKLHHYHESLEK